MDGERYYWLKLVRTFFKRHDITVLESMPNGKEYVLVYLKLLCESIDHNGDLRFSEDIAYSVEMLSAVTNTNPDTIRVALQVFEKLGLVNILDDGTYRMNELPNMVGSETKKAEAMRRLREKRRLELERYQHCGNNVTKCYPSVTKCYQDKEKDIDIESTKTDRYYYDDEIIEEVEKRAREPLDENLMSLNWYLDICNELRSDVAKGKDPDENRNLADCMEEIGKELAKYKYVNIANKKVPTANVLDTMRQVLEKGDHDELFIRTIKDINQRAIDGKVKINKLQYLIVSIYNKIKEGGII